MAIGIVKNFNKDKGFGFINMEGEERDIFFHYSQLVQEGFKTIDPGQKVEFELVEEIVVFKHIKLLKLLNKDSVLILLF